MRENPIRKSLRNRYYCMISRCYDDKNKSYVNYGARGIKVCRRWRNSFQSFYRWAIKNGFELHLSLDRKDNDGHYTPKNCRFITHQVSMQNRRNNKVFTYDGKTMVLAEWCRFLNLRYPVVQSRINVFKWSFEKAVTKKVGKHRRLKVPATVSNHLQ